MYHPKHLLLGEGYCCVWSNPEGLLLLPVCSLEVMGDECGCKEGADFSSIWSCSKLLEML